MDPLYLGLSKNQLTGWQFMKIRGNRSVWWLSGIAVMASVNFAAVSARADSDPIADIRSLLAQRMSSGSDILSQVGPLLLEIDRDGNGLDQKDIDQTKRIHDARWRAQLVSRNLVYDLDGDLVVTREEAETAIAYQMSRRASRAGDISQLNANKRQRDQQVNKIMQGDADGNQRLEGLELSVLPEGSDESRRQQNFSADLAQALIKADPNSDGLVTESETLVILSKVADGYAEAVAQFQQSRKSTGGNVSVGNCPTLSVPEKSKLVLLGTYEGASISTVSLAGQDEVTQVATLDIEAGSDPITLVISSYNAIIWKFTGATDRIAKVYVGSSQVNSADGKSAAGVTGLPKDKVGFLTGLRCLGQFSEALSPQATMASARIAKLAGRPVDTLLASYSSNVIHLPSGDGAKPSESIGNSNGLTIIDGNKRIIIGANGELKVEVAGAGQNDGLDWIKREMLRFSPGGVQAINIKDVVSEAKPEVYGVLPQQAGLLQLTSEGKIKSMGGNGFLILQKIRYPAGLAGAHSVKFTLSKGVPAPDGDPGHSCVFSEADAAYIEGSGHCG